MRRRLLSLVLLVAIATPLVADRGSGRRTPDMPQGQEASNA